MQPRTTKNSRILWRVYQYTLTALLRASRWDLWKQYPGWAYSIPTASATSSASVCDGIMLPTLDVQVTEKSLYCSHSARNGVREKKRYASLKGCEPGGVERVCKEYVTYICRQDTRENCTRSEIVVLLEYFAASSFFFLHVLYARDFYLSFKSTSGLPLRWKVTLSTHSYH